METAIRGMLERSRHASEPPDHCCQLRAGAGPLLTHTHVYRYICRYLYIPVYIYISICACVYIYMYTYLYVFMYTNLYTHAYPNNIIAHWYSPPSSKFKCPKSASKGARIRTCGRLAARSLPKGPSAHIRNVFPKLRFRV